MEKEVKNWLKKLKLNESVISMILGALVVVVVGVLVFNYFSKEKEGIKPEGITSEVGIEIGEELPATHKVKPGEHLWKIAVDYYNDGYKWTEIAKANNLTSPGLISPDQELIIPQIEITEEEAITGEKHTVKKGDCLWSIALKAYGDPYKWPEIAKANELVNPDLIHTGNELILPR